MGLESPTYISDLNVLWPTATDPKSQGDNHFRNLKAALKNTLPNVSGAVTLSHQQLNALANVSGGNAVRNGDMTVAQRGTSFTSATTFNNNDGSYTLDGWFILSDGNDIVDVTQSTTAPTGGLYSIALDVETVNKKFGICQILSQKDCAGLIGNDCVFSFKLQCSSTTKLDNIKAAIVSWSGTADAPTRDLVSTWNVEGTNPTLVSNWTYENTPANLTPTTSWARYYVTANVDTASAKNIALFIWSDVTDTTLGEFVYISEVDFEKGTYPTAHSYRTYADQLAHCQHFLPVVDGSGLVGYGFSYQANSSLVGVNFPVATRANVSGVTILAASDYTLTNGSGATGAATAIALDTGGNKSAAINVTTATNTPTTAANQPVRLLANTSAAKMVFTGAEL